MNLKDEIAKAKIDHLIMGLDLPKMRPRLFTGESLPSEGETVWFDKMNNKFWMFNDDEHRWLPEPDMRLFIYAGSFDQAVAWCQMRKLPNPGSTRRFNYLSAANKIFGHKTFFWVKVGTWRERPVHDRNAIEHHLNSQIRGLSDRKVIELDSQDDYDLLRTLKAQQQFKLCEINNAK